MSEKEVRTYSFDVEVREEEDGDGNKSPKIRGHAAVFHEETRIGSFKEKIVPGAFMESLAEDDIRALFNHDANHVLGRNKAGTLKLGEDGKGLAIEIDPPDTNTGRDLIELMRRGDITQMSFGFQVVRDSWQRVSDEEDSDLRILEKIKLFDVSPVTFPAYEGTDVAVRSHDKWQKTSKPNTKKVSIKRKRCNLIKREAKSDE